MTNWKCGDCDKIYSMEEWLKLSKQQAVERDTDPSSQHGYTSVCTCGYVFNRDKWHVSEDIKISLNWLQALYGRVSTVYLELEHFGGCYYETLVFLTSKKWECYAGNRYRTKAEARAGHKKILNAIQERRFTINKKEKTIEIAESEYQTKESRFDELKDVVHEMKTEIPKMFKEKPLISLLFIPALILILIVTFILNLLGLRLDYFSDK